MHNTTLNKLVILNKFVDAFSTTVGITEDLSSSNKTSMRVKEKDEHKHVRPTAQGRMQGANTTIVCQTHGFLHGVPASGEAINPAASAVRVERNSGRVRTRVQCDGT